MRSMDECSVVSPHKEKLTLTNKELTTQCDLRLGHQSSSWVECSENVRATADVVYMIRRHVAEVNA